MQLGPSCVYTFFDGINMFPSSNGARTDPLLFNWRLYAEPLQDFLHQRSSHTKKHPKPEFDKEKTSQGILPHEN